MRAAAPGKLVLSGAYAVLFGAPAIVTAVDRYAIADTRRPADFVAKEVRAALGDRTAPHVDASALRLGARKLGLGSSAAILVAALGAIALEKRGALDDGALCEMVLARALDAHARAQGGGSGADVAASAHGGTVAVRRVGGDLRIEGLGGSPLVFAVFASERSASTREMLKSVMALSARAPRRFATLMEPLKSAAERAGAAYESGARESFLAALLEQGKLLGMLGKAAGIPIVTEQVAALAPAAETEGAALLPSGAGGGDVILFAGSQPPSAAFENTAKRAGLARLVLALGARGVHALDPET